MGYRIQNKKLVIDGSNAEIVRKIFDDFVSHGSMKKTTDFVIREEIRNPVTGNVLKMSTVSYMLRNVVDAGKPVWGGKVYDGQHEPIISQELFEEARGMLQNKEKKKRLYKDYLFKGIIKCGECESTMTMAFTNKKNKRYHYYKCYKVVREGRHACGIKEVNAEKLESVVLDYLARLSQDPLNIENLAFRLAHEFATQQGENSNSTPIKSNELLKVWSGDLKNRIQNTLSAFRTIEPGTQLQRALIVQNGVQKVTFNRDNVEVVLAMAESSPAEEWNELIQRRFDVVHRKQAGGRRRAAELARPSHPCQKTTSSLAEENCPARCRIT